MLSRFSRLLIVFYIVTEILHAEYLTQAMGIIKELNKTLVISRLLLFCCHPFFSGAAFNIKLRNVKRNYVLLSPAVIRRVLVVVDAIVFSFRISRIKNKLDL